MAKDKKTTPPVLKDRGKCVKCSKVVQAWVYGESDDSSSFLDAAGWVRFEFGYGSKFDTDEFRGYICDNCMSDLIVNDCITTHIEHTAIGVGSWKVDDLEELKKSLKEDNNA